MRLSLFVGMSEIVCAEWGRSHLDEALSILAAPSLCRFAIFAELVLHEVVWTIHTYRLE